ncbi:hypothetical protein CDL12_11594 [Handroanthus impetiginosus]|uniref:Uncharacterized protein n=1 Tax=Handroanthus impetiginosus TaxID=429701 RepID=A0A2G9HE32_9LAMI|nr:hypothetical protein CDL12_11594 [Handroanthus impetiginosus]
MLTKSNEGGGVCLRLVHIRKKGFHVNFHKKKTCTDFLLVLLTHMMRIYLRLKYSHTCRVHILSQHPRQELNKQF